MNKIQALFILVALSGSITGNAQDKSLREGFGNPGKETRPRAYWNWLNGDVSPSGLTSDLEEAKDKGLGGLLMWDTEAMINKDNFVPAGPSFLGNESAKVIQHAIKEAERLDLELGLVTSSGWNSGGWWVTPEMAGKTLFHAGLVITGPGQIRQNLPFPEVPANCPKGSDGLPVWYKNVAVLAWPLSDTKLIPEPNNILNISTNFIKGELVWDAPPGKWQVVRFVCTNNGQQLIAASPNSKGLFIDFLDPEATRFHFEYIFKQLGIEKGNKTKGPLKTIDDDSMELYHGIQWTSAFPEWFQKYNGYDPINWLPVLIGWNIKSKEISDRFVYDFNKTVSDLLIYSHYTTGSEVCEGYGIQRVAEAGGPGPPFWESCPVDALKALGNVHIPRGEFWLGNPRNLFLIKEIASASHIYGKKYVDAESWTTWRRWRDEPFTLKLLVDRAFSEGLNRVTYHGYSNSPIGLGYPGRGYHAGLDMNPRITWWSKAHPFMDYLARCCYMLQQGKYVADVAYYYGDQAPNFWPYYHNVPEKPGLDGLENGYEYDVVNSDVILNRMAVKDGRIVFPDGMSYSILVLPDKKDMPLEVLVKLEQLVANGATVLGPKPLKVPGLNDFEGKTAMLGKLADKMWGDCNGTTIKVNAYGKGKLVWGYAPGQWLRENSIPQDFSCSDPKLARTFNFIHRETESAHIYFISNTTTEKVDLECNFRVIKGQPQLWNPEDGSIEDQLVFQTANGGIRMPVALYPGGSVFVVFSKTGSNSAQNAVRGVNAGNSPHLPFPKVIAVNKKSAVVEAWQNGKYSLTLNNSKLLQASVNQIPEPLVVEGEWQVGFNPEWGAPKNITLPTLISWTDHENEGVKFYSGKGVYAKTIVVPDGWLSDGQHVSIDLGKVGELAEVFVNGTSAGILWKPPYRSDISKLLVPGKNELKIEVINLWINRLTGDMNLPEKERLTKTNIRSDGGAWLSNYSVWQVKPSGLLGPVRLLRSKQISLK